VIGLLTQIQKREDCFRYVRLIAGFWWHEFFVIFSIYPIFDSWKAAHNMWYLASYTSGGCFDSLQL